jgi:type II secretory pathway component PulK
MTFLKQTMALTATGLQGIAERRGSSLVTIIGVTAVVGVLVSLLAIREGTNIFSEKNARPDVVDVISRGATTTAQSVLTRDALAAVERAWWQARSSVSTS